MGQPRRQQLTPVSRIIDLEGRADGHDTALADINVKLDDILQLLRDAKAILWFIGKVLAWVGGPSALAAVGFYAWRFFTGH